MSLKWLHTARHGGLVKRCHTITTIQSYNVAEHSFNAILIAHTICDQIDYKAKRIFEDGYQVLDVDGDRIAQYLMLHDLAEGYTGDIPANVKKETLIRPIMITIEDEWTKENVPEHMSHVSLHQHEYAIAKWSDTLELCMFCIDELKMGNRHPSMIGMSRNASDYAESYTENWVGDCPEIVTDIVTELRGLLQ